MEREMSGKKKEETNVETFKSRKAMHDEETFEIFVRILPYR